MNICSITKNLPDKLNTPVEEAYKVLRSNILFCSQTESIKTLTVVSFGIGEGKTTTAINLAVSMAKTGMKVLLVDADMRKSVLMRQMANISTLGLSNLLSGSITLDEVIISSNISNLYILTNGSTPLNPAELITSKKFVETMNMIKEKFDLVIIDTPALGSVIDSAVIASKTDGTIMVVKSKAVSSKDAKKIKDQLVKANARILGVVLNRIKKRDYKQYYSYFNYYGKANTIKKGQAKQKKYDVKAAID